jgi:hypothetical protein
MHEVVISDTGPLISLEKISGGFAFLRKMANHVFIPEAVLLEAGAKSRNPEEYLLDHGIADLTEIVRGIDISRRDGWVSTTSSWGNGGSRIGIGTRASRFAGG